MDYYFRMSALAIVFETEYACTNLEREEKVEEFIRYSWIILL